MHTSLAAHIACLGARCTPTQYHPQSTHHSLDTGRLNPETYRLFDSVEKHYGIRIEYTFPDTQEVVDLVREKGMFSFYEDGHGECCRVRKVRPLRKQLTTLKAWITGQRKDQSPGALRVGKKSPKQH